MHAGVTSSLREDALSNRHDVHIKLDMANDSSGKEDNSMSTHSDIHLHLNKPSIQGNDPVEPSRQETITERLETALKLLLRQQYEMNGQSYIDSRKTSFSEDCVAEAIERFVYDFESHVHEQHQKQESAIQRAYESGSVDAQKTSDIRYTTQLQEQVNREKLLPRGTHILYCKLILLVMSCSTFCYIMIGS